MAERQRAGTFGGDSISPQPRILDDSAAAGRKDSGRPVFGGNRRWWAILAVLFACAQPCRPQEFRIGNYRAEALVGEAKLLEGVQYVSFAGDTGFVNWLPSDRVLAGYVASEEDLLTRFQLNVVNLEHVLVGFSGRQLDQQTDAAILSTLREVGYGVVSLANNHALDAGPRVSLSVSRDLRVPDSRSSVCVVIPCISGRQAGRPSRSSH